MSTFINQPSIPVAGNPNSAGSASLSPGIIKTSLNPGTVATIVAATSLQLTLGSGNTKVTLNAATLPQGLHPGKEVSFKLNTEKSATLLEVSAKYSQQRLPLTQQQSQQVLQTVLQHPASLASKVEVSGQVVAVQKNQIQVSVGGQTVNLNVRNPQQYQSGQTVKLALSTGALGWELDIKQDRKQENVRLPATEAQKILTSTGSRQPISLSQSGVKQIQPILQQVSDSVFPEKPVKVSLQNIDGNKVVANVHFGAKPLASIPIDAASSQRLEATDFKVNKQSTSGPNTSTSILHEPKVLTSSGPARTSSQNQNIADKSTVYQNPQINTKAPGETVSPDIDKTIRASQNQFTELKVNNTNEPLQRSVKVPQPEESIKEIKLTQIKAAREELGANKVDTAAMAIQRPVAPKALSAAFQAIMATVNNLSKVDAQDLKQQVIEKLSNLIQSTQAGSAEGAIKSAEGSIKSTEGFIKSADGPLKSAVDSLKSVESTTKSAEAVLKAISLLSTQTSSINKEAVTVLRSALSDINVSEAVATEIKQFVKDNSSALKPEMSNISPQTPDANKIKQLLQSPTLPVTPISIISPPQTGGMVSGLINLLQVALTARLNKTHQQGHEQINQVLTQLVGAQTKAGATRNSGGSLRDLSQIEQKHNLVKVLGDLLNQHTGQKIQNAERQLQGQESFYYVLPFGNQENTAPAELLITREKPEQEDRQEHATKNSVWSLTIKLSVGELGEILTKSKVTEEDINVDFYASNENLKNLIFNYAPLLKKRFDELGLNLSIGRVERGNIPEQLAKNPYQILETRV